MEGHFHWNRNTSTFSISNHYFSTLQKSEGGGLGIGGSQSGGFMTSRGTANSLTKITTIVGALFFITSILLAILSGSNYKPSISQEIKTDLINENSNPKVPTDN